MVAGQTHLVAAYELASLQVFTVLLYSVGEQTNAPVRAALTLGQVGYYYSLEFEAQAQFRDPNPLLWNVTRYQPVGPPRRSPRRPSSPCATSEAPTSAG